MAATLEAGVMPKTRSRKRPFDAAFESVESTVRLIQVAGALD